MTSESRDRDAAESVSDVATRQVCEETYSILQRSLSWPRGSRALRYVVIEKGQGGRVERT
jgi:hypothetical protein